MGLRRNLTLLDVVALGINGVIGQGIFLLPGLAAAKLGPASILAIVAAGVLCFLIALCFAEVGSRFRATGGAYVYAKEAFGEFVGFEVGWMTCCVAVISWAALANGFTVVLGHFVPEVATGWAQKATAVGLMAALAGVNVLGAKSGAALSTLFSVAKLLPIVLFVGVGVGGIQAGLFEPFAPLGYAPFAEATLVLLYAYVGFETLVVPAGEMRNPQRSVPLALMLVLALVSVVYVAVLAVAIGVLPELAGHKNPVAAASAVVMGPVGATIIAVGICVSVFGTNAGAALVSPRRFYAMAERGDLPKIFAQTHTETGAPTYAIALMFGLSAVLAMTGSFKELAVLGVVARFAQYIPTCLAVIVLRRREAQAGGAEETGGFRLPLGPTVPLLTVGLCIWLLANADPSKLWKGGVALLVGVPLYFLAKRNRAREGSV